MFPHSYNPKMTLNMTQTSTTRARSGRKKSTVVDKKAAADKAVEVDETLKESIKGDHSRCSQPPVDIKTKVPFYYEDHVLKRNLYFVVNGRLGTM